MAELNQLDRQKLVDEGYDLDFIGKTQPQGNIKIHSRYIESGQGCFTFVDVYHYPHDNLGPFWLARIVNQPYVIALLSIGDQNPTEIRPQIDKAISEYESQMDDENLKPTAHISAMMNTQKYIRIYQGMKNASETLKKIKLRLLVYAPDAGTLMQRVHTLKRHFYSFKMTPYIDEQTYALHSIYLPMTLQEDMPNKRKGQVIESYDLGGSYMFNYINLHDPGGRYFGFTQTNGAFLFNPYNLRGNNRTCVFSLVAGDVGQGKSTFEQMLNDDAFMRGNYIRNFDVSGEYRQSTNSQHGIILDTSVKTNRVNMFQIFPTVTRDDGTVDEMASFDQNVNKIKAITHIMSGNSLTNRDLNTLGDLLYSFYEEEGLLPRDAKDHPEDVKVLLTHVNQYPTVSGFLLFLKNRYRDGVSARHPDQQELNSIHALIETYNVMVKNYGRYFDGITNIPNFDSQKVVDFDMQSAKHASVGGESQLFQAQFFNYLSMVVAQVVKNGQKYRSLIREHKLVDDKLGFRIPYFYINIDEGENYFNPKYPDVVALIADILQELRKDFCAITIAFPSLQGILFNPSDEVSNTSNYEEYHTQVKRIFGLMQYYHFFKLPGDDINALKAFFRNNKAVSPDQLDLLGNLAPRQLVTIISGEHAYRWQTQLMQEQLDRYQ